MDFTVNEKNGVMVISPQGKIMGGPDATKLHDKLLELISQDKKRIVIDLSQVDWMNSTGLSILISAFIAIRDNQGELKLANVTERIGKLLEITRLTKVFEKFESVEKAVQSFG
ncbi:MAG: hypothetical protein AMJ90_09185 [candidate division Zixibacteria bacterium SM23_73_2]|nr:MAG: hypothetical protein AMJ90_09185 [candidate division Zixibacteria bacterium SM23_73_2]